MKIDHWPNRLGFNVSHKSLRFEVYRDRQIGRVFAYRLIRDQLTLGKSFNVLATETDRVIVARIVDDYRDNRKTWR